MSISLRYGREIVIPGPGFPGAWIKRIGKVEHQSEV
jgi:hypothetical protein